jgi:uncharacterized protein YcnI
MLVLVSAAVLAPLADGHSFATPAFLRQDDPTTVQLSVHNDRQIAMSEVEVQVPEGFEVRELGEVAGWEADESTATWSGGSLPGGQAQDFGVTLEAVREPGAVTLTVEERFPDGAVVRSPVALTVVPGSSSSTPWGIVGGGILLVVVAVGLIAALVYRRVRRS